MRITFVKKRLADGTTCRKCADVEARIRNSGYAHHIDATLIADERDPQSPGALLAARHDVERAPFFVVEDDATIMVYTSYFRFVKEVLAGTTRPEEEAAEILNDHPELDLL